MIIFIITLGAVLLLVCGLTIDYYMKKKALNLQKKDKEDEEIKKALTQQVPVKKFVRGRVPKEKP